MQTFSPTDVRNNTFKSRLSIGFHDEKQAWKHMPAHFDQHTLVINGHPVMEDWEDNYMCMLAQIASHKGGTILEVGFGMGISARYIQQQEITQHLIIEANYEVYLELLTFTKDHPNVIPLYGLWEEVMPLLRDNSINGILFDTYPLCEAEIHANHFPFFQEAYRVLQTGGVLTYYSDEIDSYSREHRHTLEEAGFSDINHRICPVTPPPDCQYWTSNQILSPIVIK